jgi:predicted NUDIX family NTP pyrophosphohydrolase
MSEVSSGILMFRRRNGVLQVFLVHPGGPFWSGKDAGAWSIPKGLLNPEEDPLEAAQREFEEETGFTAQGHFIKLTPVRMKSGKVIQAWAVEGDCDASAIKSNTFSMQWPPNSGRHKEFPEVDRGGWFEIGEAERKINQGQAPLLEELGNMLSRINLDGNRI